MNVKNTFINFGALDSKQAASFGRQSTEPASRPQFAHEFSPERFAQAFPGREDPQQEAVAECSEDERSESLDLDCDAGAFQHQVTEYEFGPRPVGLGGLRAHAWPGEPSFVGQPSPHLSALPLTLPAMQMLAGGVPGGVHRPEPQFLGGQMPPEWASKTSVMLRNLPCEYTQRTLLEEMNQSGFLGCFDFFYLPIDKGTGANKGYAFVNFSDPAAAWRFKQVYDGRAMALSSDKFVSVMPAVLQGYDANYSHYANSRVMRGDPSCRPLFFRAPGESAAAGPQGASCRTPNAPGLATLEKKGGRRKGPGRLEQLVESQRREELIQQAVTQLATTVVQQQRQPKRGQPSEQEAPPVSAPVAGGAGAARRFCFSCGSKLSPGFQFCPNCGMNLAA